MPSGWFNSLFNTIPKKKTEKSCADYILSPLSFKQERMIVNGEIINNLRYADDTVLLACSQEDLQTLLDSVVESSKEVSLELNIP